MSATSFKPYERPLIHDLLEKGVEGCEFRQIAGRKVNEIDPQGRTYLHTAAEKANENALVYLLDAGAKKDLLNGQRKTVLEVAKDKSLVQRAFAAAEKIKTFKFAENRLEVLKTWADFENLSLPIRYLVFLHALKEEDINCLNWMVTDDLIAYKIDCSFHNSPSFEIDIWLLEKGACQPSDDSIKSILSHFYKTPTENLLDRFVPIFALATQTSEQEVKDWLLAICVEKKKKDLCRLLLKKEGNLLGIVDEKRVFDRFYFYKPKDLDLFLLFVEHKLDIDIEIRYHGSITNSICYNITQRDNPKDWYQALERILEYNPDLNHYGIHFSKPSRPLDILKSERSTRNERLQKQACNLVAQKMRQNRRK